MLIKFAIGVFAVLVLHMLWPSLVRGICQVLLVFAIAALVFRTVVWFMTIFPSSNP